MGGESGASKRARRQQSEDLTRQRKREELKIAEEESEIAKRKALAKPGAGGRSLLVATSPTGTKGTNLGGTL